MSINKTSGQGHLPSVASTNSSDATSSRNITVQTRPFKYQATTDLLKNSAGGHRKSADLRKQWKTKSPQTMDSVPGQISATADAIDDMRASKDQLHQQQMADHPGQIPAPADPIADMRARKDQLHQQQMADQNVNMAQQMAMASLQQLQQIVTTLSQMANANTAATCNMLMDGVKADNELKKKGGAAMVGAIGH